MSENFALIVRNADHKYEPALPARRATFAPWHVPPRSSCDDAEVRSIVQELFLAPEPQCGPRTVMFASVEAPGQSAVVCARVARALASVGAGSVCVVDADLSSPSMHQAFGVPQDPGVADMLEHAGSSRFMTHAVAPALWLLPAGGAVVRPQDDISLDRLKAITDELSGAFNWALVDIGSIGAGEGAAGMTTCADGVVLVVAANATKRAAAMKARQEIEAAGGCLLGAVLTERTYPIPEAVYRRL